MSKEKKRTRGSSVVESSDLEQSNISAEFSVFVRSAFDKMGVKMDNIRHATISWGESVFLKRKSVSIRIIRQCLDVSRHFARDSHRDAVCKTNPDTG